MKYEWDSEKDELNFAKHGILFHEAQTVFLDSRAIELFDNETEHEDRFIIIGNSQNFRFLTVIFCERGVDIIRIISARRATAEERDMYEKRFRS